MVPNLGIFLFQEILQFNKFESTYFKYDNIFLRFYPKNTQIRDLLSQFYSQTLQLQKFEDADLKYGNSFLQL